MVRRHFASSSQALTVPVPFRLVPLNSTQGSCPWQSGGNGQRFIREFSCPGADRDSEASLEVAVGLVDWHSNLHFEEAPSRVERSVTSASPTLDPGQAARFLRLSAEPSGFVAGRLAGDSKLIFRVRPSAEAARWRESSVTPVRVGSSRR
jgi:hypothetical protein